MPSECINAIPQTSSANAMGIPRAIAPSRENVNTAIVIGEFDLATP
jgi:hypothetical protein